MREELKLVNLLFMSWFSFPLCYYLLLFDFNVTVFLAIIFKTISEDGKIAL